MTDSQTCFSTSTRLIFWGDMLEHQRLLEMMDLDASAVNTESMGEQIRRSSSGMTRTAKTGLVSVSFQNDNTSFDPVAQLNAASEKLDGLSDEALRDCGVERGELQVSLYYEKENPTNAERDFLVPSRLNLALAKTGVRLRVTVMP